MKPTPDESLGALARGCQMIMRESQAVETERNELLACLREMTALYDGMNATSFWSPAVRAKVERARLAVKKADGL